MPTPGFQTASRAISMALVALVQVSAPAAEPVPIDWAKARQHWSLVPPKAQTQPRVKDTTWPRQRADHFILARIEQNDLTPSPEADARTLIRRVFFDLTGLPPSPQETRDFLADS